SLRAGEQQPVLEVDLRRRGERPRRKPISHARELVEKPLVDAQQRAVIAGALRVVVALLLARVQAVREAWIQHRPPALRITDKTTTSHENERVPTRVLLGLPGTGPMATRNVGDREAVATQDRPRAQHAADPDRWARKSKTSRASRDTIEQRRED